MQWNWVGNSPPIVKMPMNRRRDGVPAVREPAVTTRAWTVTLPNAMGADTRQVNCYTDMQWNWVGNSPPIVKMPMNRRRDGVPAVREPAVTTRAWTVTLPNAMADDTLQLTCYIDMQWNWVGNSPPIVKMPMNRRRDGVPAV